MFHINAHYVAAAVINYFKELKVSCACKVCDVVKSLSITIKAFFVCFFADTKHKCTAAAAGCGGVGAVLQSSQ